MESWTVRATVVKESGAIKEFGSTYTNPTEMSRQIGDFIARTVRNVRDEIEIHIAPNIDTNND